jgi:hypothetical protein
MATIPTPDVSSSSPDTTSPVCIFIQRRYLFDLICLPVPAYKSEVSHCPWAECDTIFNNLNLKRKQERERHVLTMHLPLLLVCELCGQRGARKDVFKHSGNCNGNVVELYDKKLALGWVFEDGTPVGTVEAYVLDFVRECALKRKYQAVLRDPCGRHGTRNTDQCRCIERVSRSFASLH